jgi:hypothetical protein
MSYPWGKIKGDTAVFRHAHLFVGIGGGAQGFNWADPRVGHLRGRFECAGAVQGLLGPALGGEVEDGQISGAQPADGARHVAAARGV